MRTTLLLWALPAVCFANLEFIIKDDLASKLEKKNGECSYQTGAKTYPYQGKDQTFGVPSGVKEVQVYLWGAGGGGGETNKLGAKGGRHDGQSSGGGGGFTTGTLAVKPGEKLTVVVGQGGLYGKGNQAAGKAMYGGGGRIGASSHYAGAGGGRSAIQRGTAGAKKIVQVLYKSGTNKQSQADRNKEVIKRTLKVMKGITYSVKAEVLRNDMGGKSEKLATLTMDGKHILPAAGCNPPGSDYACDFWTCPVNGGNVVVSNTGSIAVAFDVKETSYDCDCDIKSWKCSKEKVVKGRTPMEAAIRFTLTPVKKDLVTAGGGGGGGEGSKDGHGGGGGGLKGGDSDDPAKRGGKGGTQQGKGAGGKQEGNQYQGNYCPTPLGGGGGGGYFGGGSSTGNDKPGGGGSGYIGGLLKGSGKTVVGGTGKNKQGGASAFSEASFKTTKYGTGGIPGHPGLNGVVIVAWGSCQGCSATTDCGRHGACSDVAGGGYMCKCKAGFKGAPSKNKPVKCKFDFASVRPKGGYGAFIGVIAKTAKSLVALGVKQDVTIARIGDRKLLLDADVAVAGTMTVSGINVGAELTRAYKQKDTIASLRRQLYQQAQLNIQFLWKADESLVLYSRFDTMKSGKWQDLSGNGNHIQAHGGAKISASNIKRFCKVAVMPYGSTLTIPHSPSLDVGAHSFTISAWSNLKSRPYPRTSFTIKKGHGCYFGKGRGGARAGWEWGHGYRSNGVDFCIRDDQHNQARAGLKYDAGYTTKETAETWVHQVWVVDRDALVATSYINGKQMQHKFALHKPAKLTDKSDGSLGKLSNKDTISIGNTYGWRMDGMIDELRIYRRALSASEARALYKFKAPGDSC